VRARAYGGLARIERAATVIGQPAAAPPRGHYWSTGRLISRIGRRGSRCAAPLVLRRIVDDLPARRACMHGGVWTTGLSTTSTYDDDWDDGPGPMFGR